MPAHDRDCRFCEEPAALEAHAEHLERQGMWETAAALRDMASRMREEHDAAMERDRSR